MFSRDAGARRGVHPTPDGRRALARVAQSDPLRLDDVAEARDLRTGARAPSRRGVPGRGSWCLWCPGRGCSAPWRWGPRRPGPSTRATSRSRWRSPGRWPPPSSSIVSSTRAGGGPRSWPRSTARASSSPRGSIWPRCSTRSAARCPSSSGAPAAASGCSTSAGRTWCMRRRTGSGPTPGGRSPCRWARGIIGRCAETGMAIRVSDIRTDPRSARRDVDEQEGIRAMLCVPLKDARRDDRRHLGLLHAAGRLHRPPPARAGGLRRAGRDRHPQRPALRARASDGRGRRAPSWRRAAR